MKKIRSPTTRSFSIDRFASAFVVMLVLLFLSSAAYFGQGEDRAGVYANFQNPIKPSYLYFLTYVCSGFVGMALMSRSAAPPKGGFIYLLIALGVLHLVWMPFAPSDPETARTLVLRLNVVVMTVCCQVVLSLIKDMKSVLRAIRMVVWVTCLLNFFVIVTPDVFGIRMGVYAGRAAGLYWDPNQCASFLALLLPLINAGLARPRRTVQSLIVLGGILFTFSREGVVLWVAAITLSEVMQPGEIRPKRYVRNTLALVGFVVLLVTVMSLSWSALVDALRPHLNSDTYARLSGSDQGSTAQRLLVLKAGWDLFATNPVFGACYGATRSWGYSVSVHNMFILMLAEFGLVGGLWYVAFLFRVFKLPLRFGAVLGTLLTIESFFTHSYFDLFYYMLLVLLYWRFARLLATEGAERRAEPGQLPPAPSILANPA